MVILVELKKPQRSTLFIPGKYNFPTIKAKLQRRCPELGVEGWRLYVCNSGGHGDAEWTNVVVGLPEPSVKAFQVRKNRIPWEPHQQSMIKDISQVRVKVGDAKPPGKNGKEKKGAGK